MGNHPGQSAASQSRYLDFSSAPVGNADKDRREFVADISAFANASGGILKPCKYYCGLVLLRHGDVTNKNSERSAKPHRSMTNGKRAIDL
jgi:hypothetical protein